MKYLSLFSGIGGFELGLKNSIYDFECVGFSEIDKWAKSIYLKHFPRHNDLGDATEIKAEELPEFDLLVGGFPCQAFSLSGKRKGFDDTRGTLFFEIARICAEKKPRYLLLENVKGLLSHDGGRTYKKMLGVLSELGYDVEWEIYNSKSHSVPQNRERLYIKGYFRAKCRGEILSQKRDSIKTVDSINSTKIEKVGNLSNTNHGGKNVYSSDGLSPTLCSESIPKNGVNIVENKLKPVKFDRQVKKRIHKVDYIQLCDFLRSHKKAAGATLNEISDRLGVKKSEVDHWFRQDEFFAPPPSEVWYQLKEILDITDDKYDAFITEFEWVDGVYDMDKRAYDSDGISPTLNTKGDGLIKVAGNLSVTGHMGDDVFELDGISRTLTADNQKHPLKILEKLNNVKNNFQKVDENRLATTTTTGDALCVKCSQPRVHLDKKLTNYVIEVDNNEIEKVYGSTRKHRAETDGTYSPTLTQQMGTGGNNVPMLKFKTNTKKGYDEVTAGDGVRLCHPSSTKARGRTQKGQTGALSTQADWGTVDRDFRIRKLTPVECERLQAFPDGWTEFGKDGERISDTQRYKCLGNAVTTTVVTYIANHMFGGYFES